VKMLKKIKINSILIYPLQLDSFLVVHYREMFLIVIEVIKCECSKCYTYIQLKFDNKSKSL